MKKNLLFPGMLLLMGALSLSSCGEDPAGGSSRKGSIAPSVGIDAGFLGLDIISKAGGDITTDDLSLTVTSSDGSFTQTWDSYGDFNPEEEQFPIGDYTVEVAYGDRMAEGFDNRVVAAYYDSQDIQIFEGAATPVELTASRTHAIVSIKYTEAFEHYIKSGAVDIISSTGNGITYVYNDDKPETRSSLIVPGRTRVLVDIEKYNGTWIHNVEAANFETKARGSYTVTLDVNESSLGSAILNVVIDDNVTTEEIPVDISDDVVEAPAPEIILEGVAENGELTVVEGTYAGDPVKVMFIAKGGLAAINFTAQSTFLNQQARWEAATDPEGVEMISLEQGQRGKYQQYGLECHGVWKDPGRLAVIDMTNVINSIEDYKNDVKYKNVSTFTFTARDKYGKETEQPVSFSVKILPIELSLLNPSYLNIFDTELDIDLSFNGGSDPTDVVKIEYKNTRGTYDPVTIGSITHTSGDLYRVHLTNLPSDERDLTLRAEINGRRSPECVVPRHGVIAYSAENDVFAKRAYVALKGFNLDQSAIDNPTFVLKSDNNRTLSYTKYNENVYLVEGLVPNAVNELVIDFNNSDIYCPSIEFTTETMNQIENSTFDSSSFAIISHGSYWQNIGISGWGTNNAMTTSQGGDFAYVRISGTIQTDDGHKGSAALIRTVGWGSGNSALGSMNGAMKYADAGLLHLGETRTQRPAGYGDVQGALTTDDLNPGINFASRPSAVEFWYKYEAKNSADQGEVEVWIKDENDNVIDRKVMALPKQTSYTKISVPLNYEYGVHKAAKLYIKFLSTNDRKFLEKNSSYITPPAFGGSGGKATYMGSQLYIDDIELIY